jgi:hypothetical protein
LQVQNIDDIIRFFFVELCNYLELNSETWTSII